MVVLAFDTSGPWCRAALLHNGTVSRAEDEMQRGQAEHLPIMLERLLSDSGIHWNDISVIGVGVGPGNFTGIRISVALARGLALGLRIPAVGVTSFDAMAYGHDDVVVALLAPRDQIYVQAFAAGVGQAPALCAPEPGGLPVIGASHVVGPAAGLVAEALNATEIEPHYTLPEAIARLADARARAGTPAAPTPFYIKPADAAPPRERPPRILDDA